MSKRKNVLVYVSGSVAAYKTCDVIVGLRGGGADVRVAMTTNAANFITPATLQSISGNPVVTDLFAGDFSGHGMEHLDLSSWADLQLAVAASANLLAKLAHGMADDAVTSTALASRAPLLIAPAMETNMWESAATQTNVDLLKKRGAKFIGPVSGRLASGKEGLGRLAPVDEIVKAALKQLS